MYYSAYSLEHLVGLSTALGTVPAGSQAWCIFDNTAAGEATFDAMHLQEMRESKPVRHGSRGPSAKRS